MNLPCFVHVSTNTTSGDFSNMSDEQKKKKHKNNRDIKVYFLLRLVPFPSDSTERWKFDIKTNDTKNWFIT